MASAMSKATTSRIMKNFDHLKNPKGPLSVRIAGARKRNPLAPRPDEVHPANRIKWWNIVPGDKVRLVRGPYKDPDRVVEVLSVNKFSNLIMLKDLTYPKLKDYPDRPAMAVRAHYSNVQLFMGSREFPSEKDPAITKIKKVFATRLRMTKPRWQHAPFPPRYVWERHAAATSPRLPGAQSHGRLRKTNVADATPIPWPEPERLVLPPAGLYDTIKKAARERTFRPLLPNLHPLTKEVLPPDVSPLSIDFEHVYIRSLLNPGRYTDDPFLPVERYLYEELSNPHSRAKKQKRWQRRMRDRLKLRDRMIMRETADLRGRKRAVARREAIFRWNAKVEAHEKERRFQRFVKRGGLENEKKRLKQRHERSARKERRLRNIVFEGQRDVLRQPQL